MKLLTGANQGWCKICLARQGKASGRAWATYEYGIPALQDVIQVHGVTWENGW
jgi:hypothetical protein